MMRLCSFFVILTLAFFSVSSHAEEQVVDDYAYFAFEPDITTNYITPDGKPGFVRLTLELMVKNPDDIAIIEHHAPLLRAAVVEILGEQTEETMKSMAGKLEVRGLCFETLNQLLKQETGKKLIARLLFTKFLTM